MDGMLSQEEINALLNGMPMGDDASSTSVSADATDFGQDSSMGNDGFGGLSAGMDEDNLLTDVEKDAIGEVANISMGSSATTLYSLVNKKVNITTPVVEIASWGNLLEQYEKPCVFIQIKYTSGLDGSNILIIKEQDVKVITDLMMGGDGTNTSGELSDLHLSAISEAMNQMMGSSATSLSTMLQTMIDISPPDSSLMDLSQYSDGGEIAPFLGGQFVKISFRMQIEDLVDSNIMQLYPIEFAKSIVETFISSQMGEDVSSTPQDSQSSASSTQQPDLGMPGMSANPQTDMGMSGMGMNPQMDMGMSGMGMNPQMMGMPGMGMNPQMDMGMSGMGMNPQMMGMPGMGMNPQMGMGMPGMGMNPQMGMGMPGMGMNSQMMGMQSVNVQPAQFQNFNNAVNAAGGQENIDLIMDVPLEVTVELGRTSKSISEILNFAPGTIIELDRIAGEPIDVLVNGKFVAKGEVVVIEESFGVRVTEIIK